MMKISRHWIFAVTAIALIWSAVGVILHLTDDLVSSPEKVLALMAQVPWLAEGRPAVSAVGRKEFIDRLVESINRLDFEQRRQVREDGGELPQKFFESLTKEERSSYVDRTLQKHFDAVSQGFRLMSPEDRKQIIARARREIRVVRGDGPNASNAAEDDQKMFDDFLDIGIEEYIKSATTEDKMKLAPAIEDMHSRMQGFGR